MQVQPYLFFNSRCEEAVEFYRKTLGAEMTALMRFQDSPDPPPPDAAPGRDALCRGYTHLSPAPRLRVPRRDAVGKPPATPRD